MGEKKPMVALGELHSVVMASVLPVSPAHAEGLLRAVGAGLEEADGLRARVKELEEAGATTKDTKDTKKRKR